MGPFSVSRLYWLLSFLCSVVTLPLVVNSAVPSQLRPLLPVFLSFSGASTSSFPPWRPMESLYRDSKLSQQHFYHSITSVSLTKCSVCLSTVSPVKIQKKFGSINYVPSKKKTSNAGYIHQKPAAQTNTSIQGQEELNPS